MKIFHLKVIKNISRSFTLSGEAQSWVCLEMLEDDDVRIQDFITRIFMSSFTVLMFSRSSGSSSDLLHIILDWRLARAVQVALNKY